MPRERWPCAANGRAAAAASPWQRGGRRLNHDGLAGQGADRRLEGAIIHQCLGMGAGSAARRQGFHPLVSARIPGRRQARQDRARRQAFRSARDGALRGRPRLLLPRALLVRAMVLDPLRVQLLALALVTSSAPEGSVDARGCAAQGGGPAASDEDHGRAHAHAHAGLLLLLLLPRVTAQRGLHPNAAPAADRPCRTWPAASSGSGRPRDAHALHIVLQQAAGRHRHRRSAMTATAAAAAAARGRKSQLVDARRQSRRRPMRPAPAASPPRRQRVATKGPTPGRGLQPQGQLLQAAGPPLWVVVVVVSTPEDQHCRRERAGGQQRPDGRAAPQPHGRLGPPGRGPARPGTAPALPAAAAAAPAGCLLDVPGRDASAAAAACAVHHALRLPPYMRWAASRGMVMEAPQRAGAAAPADRAAAAAAIGSSVAHESSSTRTCTAASTAAVATAAAAGRA